MDWNYVDVAVVVGGRVITRREYLPDGAPGWSAVPALRRVTEEVAAVVEGRGVAHATREVP